MAARPRAGVKPGGARISGARPHESHALVWAFGLGYWYCTRCGGTAALATRRLRRECFGVQNVEGRRALKRIGQDMPPWSPTEGSSLESMILGRRRPQCGQLTAESAAVKFAKRPRGNLGKAGRLSVD